MQIHLTAEREEETQRKCYRIYLYSPCTSVKTDWLCIEQTVVASSTQKKI